MTELQDFASNVEVGDDEDEEDASGGSNILLIKLVYCTDTPKGDPFSLI
jgi:hypothetical protein